MLAATRLSSYFFFIAGSFAEKRNIRKIIEISLITRFMLVVLMALFAYIDNLNISVLAILTFLISTARVFGDSAISMSYLRNAEKSRWTRIGAEIDLSGNVLEATLTAAAGAIFLAAGSTNSVMIVSFLLIAALVTMLPTLTRFTHDPMGMKRQNKPAHSFKEAWQTFTDNHILLRLCFSVMLQNSALICVQSMLLIFILSTGTSDSWATLITASFAIGLIIGASVSAKALARIGVGTLITLSISIATFSIACIYLAVNYNSTLACAVTCLYGISVSLGNIAQRRYRQEIIPIEILGRVGSLFGIAIMGSMPIASVISGAIADFSGYASLFMFASALSLASLALVHTDRRKINRAGNLA